MIRRQIEFTEQQAVALRRAAQERGLSMSEVVRQAVDAHFAAQPGPDRATLRAHARALVGAFPGSEADVARRHDAYLANSIADWHRADPPRE
ncbi:MAG: hypothetical protein KKA32_01330 [Actinobacteria bacterium]|nr:hypothetical protein [Actinomycetota bacterium]